MLHDIDGCMVNGIDTSLVFVAFVTQRYCDKIEVASRLIRALPTTCTRSSSMLVSATR